MSFRNSDRKGFTLLEILIAIAILAVIATMVYASFDASIKVMDRVDRDADIYRQARLILTRLSEDLSMAYKPKGNVPPKATMCQFEGQFEGQDGVVDGRAQDTLQLTSLSHLRYLPDEPASDLNLIEYSLEAEPEGKGWALLRREEANLCSLSGTGDGQLVMGEGIHSFNLRYFDGKTKAWLDRWDPASQGLPWVVEIEIQFQESGDGQRSFKSWVELALAK
jgi:general secretion pathway protein J